MEPHKNTGGGLGRYFPVSAVARILAVRPKRIYQMIAEGKLEAVRFSPRNTRISEEELRRFIEQGKRRIKDDYFLF